MEGRLARAALFRIPRKIGRHPQEADGDRREVVLQLRPERVESAVPDGVGDALRWPGPVLRELEAFAGESRPGARAQVRVRREGDPSRRKQHVAGDLRDHGGGEESFSTGNRAE